MHIVYTHADGRRRMDKVISSGRFAPKNQASYTLVQNRCDLLHAIKAVISSRTLTKMSKGQKNVQEGQKVQKGQKMSKSDKKFQKGQKMSKMDKSRDKSIKVGAGNEFV